MKSFVTRFMPVVLLISSLTFAQTASNAQAAAQAPPAAAAEKPAEVPLSAPVVTVNGFCPGRPASGAECKTEISRAELETLAKALGAPEARRRELANAYAQMLVMNKLAEDRGIDKKPETQEVLRFLKMQTIAQLLGREIREEAANIPPADIEKYYADHAGEYIEASLQRIFVPKMPANSKEKVDEAAVKAEGAKMAAAAKVPTADFAKLQKQAYDDLKITATPPPTELKDVRRGNIPPGQVKAFDMNVGEVSDALDEPGGIYIYKVVSKKTLTQSEVEPDIKKTLEQERARAEMLKLTGSIKLDYNEAYFAEPAAERPQPPQLQAPRDATAQGAPAAKAPPAAAKIPTAPKTPK